MSTHHALHALGNRLLGYTQELFDDSEDVDPEAEAAMWAALADTYPHIHRTTISITHGAPSSSAVEDATISSSSSSPST